MLDDGVEIVQRVQEEVQGAEVVCGFLFYQSAFPQAYLEESIHRPPEIILYQNNWVSNPIQTHPIAS